MTAWHPSLSPTQPFLLLPDASAYARPESNRLFFGFREKESVSLNPRALPEKMTGCIFTEDPDGWKSLIEGVPDFRIFMPIIEKLEIPHYIQGLSNYTPDGNFILGPYPDLDGILAATSWGRSIPLTAHSFSFAQMPNRERLRAADHSIDLEYTCLAMVRAKSSICCWISVFLEENGLPDPGLGSRAILPKT
jgi:hypothetical protein